MVFASLAAVIGSGIQLIWLSKVMIHDKVIEEDETLLAKAEIIYSVDSAIVFLLIPIIYTAVVYIKILLKIQNPRRTSLPTPINKYKALLTFLLMHAFLALFFGQYFMPRILLDTGVISMRENLSDQLFLLSENVYIHYSPAVVRCV